MDPDATLIRLKELAKEIHESPPQEVLALLASEMATLFEALDEWLAVKRGKMPTEWRWIPLLPPDPPMEDPEPII